MKIDPSALHEEAHAEGVHAGRLVNVAPMVVRGAPRMRLTNDTDPNKKTYFVEGGVCGFAHVSVRPARGKFVSYMKAEGLGRLSSYGGGFNIHVHEFGQSLTRKDAYARAYADVLRSYGINAYAESRID